MVDHDDNQTMEERRANMKRMAWIHDAASALARRVEVLTLARDQYKLAVEGEAPPCACCEVKLEWRHLYRCFHCDLWLCPACSKAHFHDGPVFGDYGG